jgi:hypothetical protein
MPRRRQSTATKKELQKFLITVFLFDIRSVSSGGGTAKAGIDYPHPISTEIEIFSGGLLCFGLQTVSDTVFEGNKTLILSLTKNESVSSVEITGDEITVTIVDDDGKYFIFYLLY